MSRVRRRVRATGEVVLHCLGGETTERGGDVLSAPRALVDEAFYEEKDARVLGGLASRE